MTRLIKYDASKVKKSTKFFYNGPKNIELDYVIDLPDPYYVAVRRWDCFKPDVVKKDQVLMTAQTVTFWYTIDHDGCPARYNSKEEADTAKLYSEGAVCKVIRVTVGENHG